MELEGKKFISIGGGCFSNILLTRLDKLTNQSIRVAGPIDNLRSIHGIIGSLNLFNRSLEEQLLGKNANPIITVKKDGKKAYDECDKEFKFKDFAIIHNDWTSDKCRNELKKRFNNFYNFYEKSKTDNNYWFIYTLCEFDKRAVEEVKEIRLKLKELGILDRLIIIGEQPTFESKENVKPNNELGWPNFDFPEWKEVFGEQYIVIDEANYYDLAAEKFLRFLKNI